MKKTTTTLLSTSVVSSGFASITIDVNQNFTSVTNRVYIDLDNGGSFSTTDPADADFYIQIKLNNDGPDDLQKAQFNASASSGVVAFVDDGYWNRYSYGDKITGTAADNSNYLYASTGNLNGPYSEWSGFSGTAYAAFGKGTNKGWIEFNSQVSSESGRSFGIGTIFYGDEGKSVYAGSFVPEPAATGAAMALLAGSAALFSRRRRAA